MPSPVEVRFRASSLLSLQRSNPCHRHWAEPCCGGGRGGPRPPCALTADILQCPWRTRSGGRGDSSPVCTLRRIQSLILFPWELSTSMTTSEGVTSRVSGRRSLHPPSALLQKAVPRVRRRFSRAMVPVRCWHLLRNGLKHFPWFCKELNHGAKWNIIRSWGFLRG